MKGSVRKLSINSEINRIGGQVSSQTDLINQIKTMLREKGAATLSKCNIKISSGKLVEQTFYLVYENEKIKVKTISDPYNTIDLINVLCGSMIYINNNNATNQYLTSLEILADLGSSGIIIKAPDEPEVYETITINSN